MTEEPPFRSVAIVGLGLIGGSLALATRERWPSIRVIGVDTDAVIAHARGAGAIDRSAPRLAELSEADLIVLAAPVQQNLTLLADVPGSLPVLVTDVGSTKLAMVEAGRKLAPPARFVAGHPLGGGERGGFAYARADLFAGRPWILTPDARADAADVERLQRYVAGLGAMPATMPAAAHDEVMAFLSHLPQIVASTLMATVGDATGPDALRLAGRGLIDSTRLASSPADIWRDVCQTNAVPIVAALDQLIARLGDVRDRVATGQPVDALFDASARWRAELMKGRE